jgi:hypothetical protein
MLPLAVVNLDYNDMYCRHQAGRSMSMSNALRSMYLLTTTLRGMWRISNWYPLRGMNKSHLEECICLTTKVGQLLVRHRLIFFMIYN